MTAKEQGLPDELRLACARIVRDCLDRDQSDDDIRPLELWIADSVLALASDTGERGVEEVAVYVSRRGEEGAVMHYPPAADYYTQADLDAARREIPEHVRKLVGRIDCYRLCMSYNESYFGEPPGLLKGVFAELAHAMNPIYPSGKTAMYPAAPTFPGVTIATAEHPQGMPADELIAALRAQPAGGGEDAEWRRRYHDRCRVISDWHQRAVALGYEGVNDLLTLALPCIVNNAGDERALTQPQPVDAMMEYDKMDAIIEERQATQPEPVEGGLEAKARAMFEAQADKLAMPWDRQWEPTKRYWREKASTPPESGGQGEIVAMVCNAPAFGKGFYQWVKSDAILPIGTKLYAAAPAQPDGVE